MRSTTTSFVSYFEGGKIPICNNNGLTCRPMELGMHGSAIYTTYQPNLAHHQRNRRWWFRIKSSYLLAPFIGTWDSGPVYDIATLTEN
jgi:hypothetical protein